MVRVAPYMSERVSRNIIGLIPKTDGSSVEPGRGSVNLLIEKKNFPGRVSGAYGMSAVPFNRCFIDSFNIVVT